MKKRCLPGIYYFSSKLIKKSILSLISFNALINSFFYVSGSPMGLSPKLGATTKLKK